MIAGIGKVFLIKLIPVMVLKTTQQNFEYGIRASGQNDLLLNSIRLQILRNYHSKYFFLLGHNSIFRKPTFKETQGVD